MAPGKDDYHIVPFDPPTSIPVNNLGPVDRFADFNFKPGFLPDLAGGRFLEWFSDFDNAARKTPKRGERCPCPTNEKDPGSGPQGDADGENRSVWILAQILNHHVKFSLQLGGMKVASSGLL